MKKTWIISCLTTATLMTTAMLTGCGGDGSKTKDGFRHVTVERSVGIDNGKDSPQCQVQLDILAANDTASEAGRRMNEQIVKKIFDMELLSVEAAADSFANVYTRDYRKNMAPLYREDRADAAKRPWYEYRYTVTTETRKERKGVTSYLITLDYYEGGAHGIKQLLTLNMDNKTGEMVTLSDVYGENFEQPLTERLLEALLEKTGARNIGELHDRGYLYSMDMFVPANFIVGDDEVTFIYNPYEIAPYSEGRIELVIKD